MANEPKLNLSITDNKPKSESESKASETPHQGDTMDTVVEKPAAKTREEAAKAKKAKESDA